MSEERIERIETKLAHQEALLQDLNDALVNQQESLMKLEALCESLRLRVVSLSEAAPGAAPADEMPPHY